MINTEIENSTLNKSAFKRIVNSNNSNNKNNFERMNQLDNNFNNCILKSEINKSLYEESKQNNEKKQQTKKILFSAVAENLDITQRDNYAIQETDSKNANNFNVKKVFLIFKMKNTCKI